MGTRQVDLKALLESRMENIEPAEGSRASIESAEMHIPKNLMYDAESTVFKPETKPVLSEAKQVSVEEAKAFENEMDRFIKTALISGRDYGKVPYGDKPTLFKSGAEKIQIFLGLIARAEIVNRIEDYNAGFFSYEAKVFLIDYNGVVRAEGVGICNTKEGKYLKSNGYAVMNTVLKMAKKRALVDAVLNVAALSARFTQDMEDGMSQEPDKAAQRKPEAAVQKPGTAQREPDAAKAEKPAEAKQERTKPKGRRASKKQMEKLELLMQQSHSSASALNKYVKREYGIDDYTMATSAIASTLIQKFEDAARQA